ncbi:MAG: glucosidase [Gammaproteobacteria bacterium]|jgi:hypothetical protein
MANKSKSSLNAERQRLKAQWQNQEDWYLWGPYLAERAWGTVREDYSKDGNAWEYFTYEQSRSRAYRWGEDGLGGISDNQQRLCFALALWNGKDPYLKERAFGLTGKQGNHGEDVKEYYFYLDATPSHSYLHYLYRYPQNEFPYEQLVRENRRRGYRQPAYDLLDTGVFANNRFWDVEVIYAKHSADKINIRIRLSNHGPEPATLHVLPTLWFRNTWSWEKDEFAPEIVEMVGAGINSWCVRARHETLGDYYLYGRQQSTLLFTNNETNNEILWGGPNRNPYVKDAVHRYVVNNEDSAVNYDQQGSKFAAHYQLTVAAGEHATIDLVLSAEPLNNAFDKYEVIFSKRQSEASVFYDELLPEAGPEDHRIMRQAFAGMIWNKQFYHYDVQRWLTGDLISPPQSRKYNRNRYWQHFKANDILSMPDTWEYPWFAAWDLAFHCSAFALIDIDFAKQQMELILKENYFHPNGQVPAYEWEFGDVNPPVHAMGVLKVYRAERIQRGIGDLGFLQRVFNKLLLNYSWWVNRKDSEGHNVFEGGFMGLDNISVLNRSEALPSGFTLKQADATGWMAMFALNMTVIALELAVRDPDYEDIAIQTYTQFLSIANTIAGYGEQFISLWDENAGFFKDLIIDPQGKQHRIDVYSWVGLIPLFATEVVDKRLLENVPRFRKLLYEHKRGVFNGNVICQCPEWENERGEHLLALVSEKMLPRILERLLNEDEFLSPYGVRSVSKIHEKQKNLGHLPGVGQALIEYVPGEANSGLFGGNSNWRGPVWLPTNYSLIQALEKFQRFLGDNFKVPVPSLDNQELSLKEIATLLADRLVSLYRADEHGVIPAFGHRGGFQSDPHWQGMYLFYEYFHGDNGQGLGASHQTGWTGLIANLVMRKYRRDIPEFWRKRYHELV